MLFCNQVAVPVRTLTSSTKFYGRVDRLLKESPRNLNPVDCCQEDSSCWKSHRRVNNLYREQWDCGEAGKYFEKMSTSGEVGACQKETRSHSNHSRSNALERYLQKWEKISDASSELNNCKRVDFLINELSDIAVQANSLSLRDKLKEKVLKERNKPLLSEYTCSFYSKPIQMNSLRHKSNWCFCGQDSFNFEVVSLFMTSLTVLFCLKPVPR